MIECGNISVDSALNKNWDDLPPEKQADITRRVEDLKRKYSSVSASVTERGVPRSQNRAALATFENAMRIGNNVSISPGTQKGLAYHMAINFAQEHAFLGLADDLTEVGSVRRLLADMKRRGGGSTHQLLREMHFIDASVEAEKRLEVLRRQAGVDKNTFDRIKIDAIEIANQPYLQKDLGVVGPEGLAFLRQRQKRFFQGMQEAGIPQQVAQAIAKEATTVANMYREVYEVLTSLGVKINDADGLINYLPRNLSPQAVQRITWSKNADSSFNFYSVTGQPVTESLPSVFAKSRNSDHYIIEDAVILEEAFKAIAPEAYEAKGGINAMLEDSRKLRLFITEDVLRTQKGAELVEGLIDLGYMSRIPMTGTEMFDFMKQYLDLPFRNLNEYMATDLREIARLYRNQAERLVGRSFITNRTVRAAMDEGWGVTSAQRTLNPEKYGKYVQLTTPDPNANIDTVITHAEAARFLSRDAQFNASKIYVHPVVSDLYKAQTRVLSDPNQMGIISRFLWDLRTKWGAMTLATSGFVFRQAYTPFFQVWAGGGRLDLFASDLARVMKRGLQLRVQGKGLDTFDELFDNTKAIYRFRDGQAITEQQLWREAQKAGIISEVIPWLGSSAQSPVFRPTAGAMETIRRHAAYVQDVFNRRDKVGARGVAEGLYRQGSDAVSNFADRTFHGTMVANVMFDNVGRFALLKALTDETTLSRAVRAAQGNFRFHLDFDEALERVRQYFFIYDDPGRFDEFMTNIRPFWMFMSRNTFATWRMMVREPGRFMAYQRLFAAFNEPEETEDVPKGAYPDWLPRIGNHMWVRRDENGNPAEMFTLPRSQFDPVAEGTNEITEWADILLSSMGIWPGSTGGTISDRLNDLPWSETQTNRALNKFFSETYGYMRAAYVTANSQITGTATDPYTGRTYSTSELEEDSFLGFNVHPITRLAWENFVPVLRNVDRANPFGLFGTPAEFDEQGNVIKEGRPAWTGASRKPRASDFRAWWQRGLAVVGFNVYSFDVMEQMGWRGTDINRALREGTNALNDERKKLREMDPRKQRTLYNQKLERIREMEALHAALALDYFNLRAWAEQHNMSFNASVRKMRTQNLQQSALRGLTEEQENTILEAVYQMDFNGDGQIPESIPEYFGDLENDN